MIQSVVQPITRNPTVRSPKRLFGNSLFNYKSWDGDFETYALGSLPPNYTIESGSAGNNAIRDDVTPPSGSKSLSRSVIVIIDETSIVVCNLFDIYSTLEIYVNLWFYVSNPDNNNYSYDDIILRHKDDSESRAIALGGATRNTNFEYYNSGWVDTGVNVAGQTWYFVELYANDITGKFFIKVNNQRFPASGFANLENGGSSEGFTAIELNQKWFGGAGNTNLIDLFNIYTLLQSDYISTWLLNELG